MALSFDPIPDQLWEDWKWFVYPEGLVLGMREGRHRVPNSSVVLTPCYVVNIPKLIMSDIMWTSRLESTPDGTRDTGDYLRRVNVSVDSLMDGIIFLLSQNPMVVKRRGEGKPLPEALRDSLESDDELILVQESSESERKLSRDDLAVEFFNPFDTEAEHRAAEMLGLIAPEACIKELALQKADEDHSMVRETILTAIEELKGRGMILVEGDAVVGMTERGRSLLEVEPVNDTLACRCEVESLESEAD